MIRVEVLIEQKKDGIMVETKTVTIGPSTELERRGANMVRDAVLRRIDEMGEATK